MAMGERTWEVLMLLTVSSAACLMMFIGVSSWSDLNQPIQVYSQPQGSAVDVPPWIYGDFVVPEARDVPDGGVVSKARSYYDGFLNFVGSQLVNPLGVWSGEESMPVQEVEDENGVVANVKSFFFGIGDSIKRWGQKTISPPAIFHATEPLGRFPHTDIPPTATLASKLTAIVGKVMEAYYAENIVAEGAKTCSVILEEQTKKLVKSLKYELKGKLCNDELQSVIEEKFCNFYRSHPKLATLMVFTKLEVDPVGVALMRTTTSELCASSNGNLVHSVHKMEKLARRLRLSSRGVGQNELAVHEHEHQHKQWEHEHQHEQREHDGLQASLFDIKEGQSCKECYLEEVHHLMKDIKAQLASTCQAPTTCMVETCAFVKEHRYLAKTYLVLNIRPWEMISTTCAVSCRSSESYLFPLGLPHYPQTAVSQPHAPNLPWFGHGFIRRLEVEQAGLGMDDPNMPVSHPAEFDGFNLRRSFRCRRLARLQAFRRAMQLRGKVLGSPDSGLDGDGQAHLVVVVNGHPFGPSDIRDIFSGLQKHTDAVADSRSWHRSDVVILRPFHKHLRTVSDWKDAQSNSGQFVFELHPEHQAEDSVGGETRNLESVDRPSVKPEEMGSEEGTTEALVVSDLGEGYDGTSTTGTAVEGDVEASSSPSSSDLGESTTSEDSSEEGSRAAM